MFNISGADVALTQPAVKNTDPSKQGWFIDGDPAQGIAGTDITADFLNQLQANVRAFLTAAGITPSATVNNQLKQATDALYGGAGTNAANGTKTLPGGTIIKWGTGTTSAAGSLAVSFTGLGLGAFPTSCVNVQCTHAVGAASATAFGAGNITASGFTAYASSAVAGAFYWYATGY